MTTPCGQVTDRDDWLIEENTMAYQGELGARPPELDGCWSSWSEQQMDNVVKSPADSGVVKTRPRFTGIQRRAEVMVRMRADKYQVFMDWFNVDQRQGAIPTTVKTPYGTEEIWQFITPPLINWPEAGYFEASTELYAQSGWND